MTQAHRRRRPRVRRLRGASRRRRRGDRRDPGDLRGQRAHPLGRRPLRRVRLPRHRAGAVRPRRARVSSSTTTPTASPAAARWRARSSGSRRCATSPPPSPTWRRHRAGRRRRLLLRRQPRLAGGERAAGRRRGRLLRRADPRVDRPCAERSRRCSTSASSIDGIPLDQVDEIVEQHPDVEIHVYEGAQHGFNCDARGVVSTRCRRRSRSGARSSSSSPTASSRDHRLPRPLHHGAAAARRSTATPSRRRCAVDPDARRREGHDRRSPTTSSVESLEREPAAVAARARHRPHPLLAAGELDGAPHRQRAHQSRFWSEHCNDLIRRVCDLYPDQLRPRVPAPAVARVRRSTSSVRELRRCVDEMGFVGCNLNPDPSGGHWNGPPLVDRVVLAAVRGDVRARRAGDDPRQRDVQPELPLDRLALPRGRHDRVHAGAHVRAVPRLPGDALGDPARRRRRAVPLGPVQGHGRGECRRRMAHARRADGERLLRHVRLPPAGDRPARRCRADRQHPVRVRDGRRGARASIPTPASTTTTPKRYVDRADAHRRASARQIFEGNVRRVYPRLDGSERPEVRHESPRRRARRSNAPTRRRSTSWARPAPRPCTRRSAASATSVRTSRPIQQDVRIAGSAVTVLSHPGDNIMIHAAVEVCQAGDVLVVVNTAPSTHGMFGELLATSLHGAAACAGW